MEGGREGGGGDWWNQNFPGLEGMGSRLDFILNTIKMPLESKQGSIIASLHGYSFFKGREGCFMEYGFGVRGGTEQPALETSVAGNGEGRGGERVESPADKWAGPVEGRKYSHMGRRSYFYGSKRKKGI